MSKKKDVESCRIISWTGFIFILTGVVANLILKEQSLEVRRKFSFFYYSAPIGLFITSLCQIVLYLKYKESFNWEYSLKNRPLDTSWRHLESGKKAFSTFLAFLFLFICSIIALSLPLEAWMCQEV